MGITAVIVGAGIAAGGSVAASKIGADASTKAAGQQVNAANQALGVQQQQYQNTQKLLAPYQYGGPVAASLNHPVTNQTMNPAPTLRPTTTLGALATYGGGQGLPGQSPQMPSQMPPSGAPTQNGGMVTVQAPTGETRQMPMAQAQLYAAKGARILG